MEQKNEHNAIRARRNYEILCRCLDEKGWQYTANAETMTVNIGFLGDDIPMPVVFIVDENCQVLRVASVIPFTVSHEHMIDICLAVTHTNGRLPFGTFVFDMEAGVISYRNSTCFIDGDIGMETIELLTDIACTQIDRFNDLFYAIEKGMLSFEDFISIG